MTPRMNGFNVIEPEQPAVIVRVFCRKLKANAEIQNFWALRQRDAFVSIMLAGRFVE
jgi:hypothetical protein